MRLLESLTCISCWPPALVTIKVPEFPISCCVVLTVSICGAGVRSCALEDAGASDKLGVAAAGTKAGKAPAKLTMGVTLTVASDTGADVP